MKGQHRYPGTQAFQASDAAVFYGRDKDIQQLMRLLRLEQLIVLHGKSGLGKSSLINAGIIPVLREHEDLDYEEVRFGAFQGGEGEEPLAVLKNHLSPSIHPLISRHLPDMDSLWLRCKSHQLAQEGANDVLLIFDQFEELFSYPAEQVKQFKAALAELIHTEVPTELRRAIRFQKKSDDEKISPEDRKRLLAPMSVKILTIIRSDRLSLLDEFTSHIPNMLVNLYELSPLNTNQAKAAIVEPASKKEGQFISSSFSFEEKALASMLSGLSNEQGEIESFQLQLLCQYLENKVVANPSLTTIKEADFGGKEGIQDILQNYYERQLADLSPSDQLTARRFIEEGLISNDNRVPVAAGVEQSRFGVGPELLDKLLDSRLIRAENIHLGKIYELSHDTLVEPVSRSLLIRKEEEERQRIEKELAAERERLKSEQAARRRNRIIAILGFGLFVIAAIAGIFALIKYKEAETARLTAEANEKRAAASALAARAWEIYSYDHTLAARVAEASLKIDSNNQEVIQTLGRIINNSNSSFYQKVLTEHFFDVRNARFSDDGQFIATVGYDSKVVLWDREGNLIHRYLGRKSGDMQVGHRGAVFDLAFSADGSEIFSVGDDKMIKVWSSQSGELLREWQGHDGPINAITRIASSNNFVTAGADLVAHIWDSAGTKLGSLRGHRQSLTDVSSSQDGQYILTTSTDGIALLWNRNGQLIRTISNEGVTINAGVFSPDGRYIALANSNNTAEIRTIQGVKVSALGGHKGQVVDINYFPDGNYLITSSEDATAKVWTPNGEEILSLNGHKKRLSFAIISPDAKTIITGGYDFTAKLWDVDLNLGVQRHRHSDFIYGIDIDDQDKLIVTCSKDFTAKVWDLDGQWQADLLGHTNIVLSAFFIPESQEIITSSLDGTVKIWSSQGEELSSISPGIPITMARISGSGDKIVSCSTDGRIFTWNRQGDLLSEWIANPSGRPIGSIDIHPESSEILSSQGPVVKRWTWEGELLDSIDFTSGAAAYKAYYSPDGKNIFTAAQEYPFREWSLDGQVKRKYFGHSDVVYGLSIHPSQNFIASAGWDKTLKIWDKEGNLLKTIPHKNSVYCVDFNSDASIVVTGEHSNIGYIWNQDGELLAALGERVNPRKILTGDNIATLANIPFSISEENLPNKYLEVLAGTDPQQYVNEANITAEMASNNQYSLEEKIDLFDRALAYFDRAESLITKDTSQNFAQERAGIYRDKGEQLLIHGKFKDAITTLEQGLTYADLDYLVVLNTLANLYNGQFEKVQTIVEANKDRSLPQIDWYDKYPEAIASELDHFENQFGISHPDAEKLLKLLE